MPCATGHGLPRLLRRRETRHSIGFVSRQSPSARMFRANQQLREDMWDYRSRPSADENENILRFTQSATTDYGATALDLVNQAAEIFSGMEITRAERMRAPGHCAQA
jgi:hypothetical protein